LQAEDQSLTFASEQVECWDNDEVSGHPFPKNYYKLVGFIYMVTTSCRAVFVDTDCLPAHDSRVGDLVENKTEVELVCRLADTLIRSGIREEQIGIITLYRQQVKLLGNLLQCHKDIEILTADRSQGRDKDCIIISMVRSNDSGNIGDLVKDWRPMNVSFTHVRSKLIIIGSRKTLQGVALLLSAV